MWQFLFWQKNIQSQSRTLFGTFASCWLELLGMSNAMRDPMGTREVYSGCPATEAFHFSETSN